jgi:indole-3-glycerol phosphate synthase
VTTVLAGIIEGVLADLSERALPIAQIKSAASDAQALRGALAALQTAAKMALISEVKRASPSKGALAQITDPAALAAEYESAGATICSVLTEARRFSGSIADFKAVREAISIPMLRKDFIVTEYQVYESRAIGSDLMLLIVAGLADSQLRDFYQLGSELGMDILVEIHNETELERALEISPAMIGVNSRNLKTLEVDFENFRRILPQLPSDLFKVAESGISNRAQVTELSQLGANAILVGETLVRANSAKAAIQDLLGDI